MCTAPSEDIFVREDLAAQINADIPKDTTASIRVGIRATNAEEKIMNGLIEAFNERAASRRVQAPATKRNKRNKKQNQLHKEILELIGQKR